MHYHLSRKPQRRKINLKAIIAANKQTEKSSSFSKTLIIAVQMLLQVGNTFPGRLIGPLARD